MTPVNDELDLWGESSRPTVVGERVRLCRHAMAWQTGRLAETLQVSRAAVNYWESGDRQPTNSLPGLCAALEVSPAGLAQQPPPPPSSGPFFRSMLKKESVRLQEHASAYVRLVADMATYFERRVGLNVSSHQLIGSFQDRVPAEAAQKLRTGLSLLQGPVDNMIRVAEAAGAITAFGIPPTQVGIPKVKSVDAYSAIVGRWPIIVMTSRGDYYRQRWDVAHELGHLVLHDGESEINDLIERQANQFAAEILLPADDFNFEMPLSGYASKELEAALSPAKEYWGVSFRALIRRARELEQISEAAFRHASVVLDSRWRNHEPGKMQMLEMPDALPGAYTRFVSYGAEKELIQQEVGIPRILFHAMLSRHPLHLMSSDHG